MTKQTLFKIEKIVEEITLECLLYLFHKAKSWKIFLDTKTFKIGSKMAQKSKNQNLHAYKSAKIWSSTGIFAWIILLCRLLDIEYFRYSILSNIVFDTVFIIFSKSADIDIEYSLLFWTGIDIEYSLLSDRYWRKSISILSNTLIFSFFNKRASVNKKRID